MCMCTCSAVNISSVLVIYCINNYIVYCKTVLWYVSVYLADVLSPQTVYSQVQSSTSCTCTLHAGNIIAELCIRQHGSAVYVGMAVVVCML